MTFVVGVASVPAVLYFSGKMGLLNIDDNIYVTFLGSYFGAVFGMLGVMFVARFQNKNQKEILEQDFKEQNKRMNEMEKNQRERLFLETNINLRKAHIDDVNNLHSLTLNLIKTIMNLYRTLGYKSEGDPEEHEMYDNQIYRLTKEDFQVKIQTLTNSIIDNDKYFNSIDNDDVDYESNKHAGNIYILTDMFDMLSIKGLNLYVFDNNYGHLVIHSPTEPDILEIKFADELLEWINKKKKFHLTKMISDVKRLKDIS